MSERKINTSSTGISTGMSTKPIQRQDTAVKEADQGGCWKSFTRGYDNWSKNNLFGVAITQEYGAIFNVLVSHAIFWPTGFIEFMDYEYDNKNLGSKGQIASGSNGSGAWVITLIMLILANTIFIYKLCRNVYYEKQRRKRVAAEKKRIEDEEAAMAAQGMEEED